MCAPVSLPAAERDRTNRHSRSRSSNISHATRAASEGQVPDVGQLVLPPAVLRDANLSDAVLVEAVGDTAKLQL